MAKLWSIISFKSYSKKSKLTSSFVFNLLQSTSNLLSFISAINAKLIELNINNIKEQLTSIEYTYKLFKFSFIIDVIDVDTVNHSWHVWCLWEIQSHTQSLQCYKLSNKILLNWTVLWNSRFQLKSETNDDIQHWWSLSVVTKTWRHQLVSLYHPRDRLRKQLQK